MKANYKDFIPIYGIGRYHKNLLKAADGITRKENNLIFYLFLYHLFILIILLFVIIINI